MPLVDALMSCRLVLSLRDADSTQFNSNVHVKSLWASMQYDSEDHNERGDAAKAHTATKNDTFALATVARSQDNTAVPVNIK